MSDIRFVLTKYQTGILAYSIDIQNNRLETIRIYADSSRDDKGSSDIVNIGDIFVAKVMNVSNNINAAFIDYQKGKHGYLPFSLTEPPILLNRTYDGKLRAGDELLVQLEKEAVRSKDPVFTCNLSLAGEYCVITSGNRKKGVSKKCPRIVREQLLKAIPDNIDYGIIVRTNASELIADGGCQLELLEQECQCLNQQMHTLLNDAIHRSCYSRVKRSISPYLEFLRDNRKITYSRLITDDTELFNELSSFLRSVSPELFKKLTLYTDSGYSLNKLYSIETKIKALTDSRVWLKSGAYLVIEKTEAMYVIDVNSGKNISRKSNAEYILSVNLEAAQEIMYQVRLRNLTGIIIVDFINMENPDDKEKLLYELKQCARRDTIQTTIVDMTPLDLVEITRRKNVKSLAEQLHFIANSNSL